MNKQDYGSREACQKLFEKGIVVETEAAWSYEPHDERRTEFRATTVFTVENVVRATTVWEWKLVYKKDGVCTQWYPALSMAEVWRELLPFVFGHYEDMRDRVWTALLSDNPTDALINLLIDLLIHIKGLEKHENSLL